ncbi:MAG: hypothetical protein ACI9G1_005368 [Pirellulaceae bacterium]|jgi:uncharacterized protein YtpQ (UPF0354 family)
MGIFDRFLSTKSERKFALMVIDRLKLSGDDRDIQYESQSFRLLFSDHGQPIGYAALRNIYDEFHATGKSDRETILSRYARAALSYLKDVPTDFADARPDILPVIRTKSHLEFMRLRALLEGHKTLSIPHTDIGDHLTLILVYDRPESRVFIDRAQLELWNKSFYELLEVARENLSEIEFAFASVSDALYASLTSDNYDSSRILLTDMVNELRLKGAPIAMLPNPDSLLLTGSKDYDGLRMMLDFAKEAMAEPRAMYAVPLRLDDDNQWQTWCVPDGHSLSNEFRILRLHALASDYAEQKQLLEQLFELERLEVDVAPVEISENKKAKTISSFAVWQDGREILLPVTDRVVFVDQQSKTLGDANWRRVNEVLGSLLEETEHYPLRYRVRSFPSNAQLAELGLINTD